jgi:hypothetical protein
MMKLFKRDVVVSLGALCVALSLPAAGDDFFNNSQNDLHYRLTTAQNVDGLTSTAEYGDEIDMASIGDLTNFSFEFWGTNTLSPANLGYQGAIQGRVRFYYNNGAPDPTSRYATPGTMFYDSGWFYLNAVGAGTPTARSTLAFGMTDFQSGDKSGLFKPGEGLPVENPFVTWTVEFQGLGNGDELGVDLYYPPTVGLDYNDYWVKGTGSAAQWLLYTNSDVPAVDFAAVFQGTTIVPEPTVLALSAVGALALFATNRRLRRKA